MTSFFGKLKSGTGPTSPSIGSSPSKKDGGTQPQTPLEKMLVNAGPVRSDGSDKFFGMENFGNTCYCNSILQCLYYSVPFREHVLNYPARSPTESLATAAATATPRAPFNPQLANGAAKKPGTLTTTRNLGSPPTSQIQKPEDKDSPEYKKKQALIAGPILNMSYQNTSAYSMSESLFTALKDIFEAVVGNQARSGVVSPVKFLEVLRRENEMFRSAMHQDAHEFLNLLLNTVVENVEAYAKKVEAEKGEAEKNGADGKPMENGNVASTESPTVSFPSLVQVPRSTAGVSGTTRWVHELFEGTLTSETRCLTCENVSQRDEPFLDLSVDLDQHSSVTSCLRRFSEEEMLCERNKFHCDNCGGLQEAEKRMKIKRLPKILALHLKRFKYTEDLQRLQKLFHKVVYPYHLRLFNTTDDAQDADRLYELYAVVVHIGGGPYHGHYVAIIKTEDRGWLLFDDEMVEPVDKSFVRNFFGDRPGLACAYVLFYQETTLDAVQREQANEGKMRAHAKDPVGLGLTTNGLADLQRVRTAIPATSPTGTEHFTNLDHAMTAPSFLPDVDHTNPLSPTSLPPITSPTTPISPGGLQSRKEKAKEEKERKAAEKEKEKADKLKRKELEKEGKESHYNHLFHVGNKKHDLDSTKVGDAAAANHHHPPSAEDEKAGGGGGGVTFDGLPNSKENMVPNGSATVSTLTSTSTSASASALAGLDRFRRSKSLRFSSLGKKDKPPVVLLDDTNMPSSTATAPASAAIDSTDHPLPPTQHHQQNHDRDKDKDKDKEKRNRFSIRKKSFGMLQ